MRNRRIGLIVAAALLVAFAARPPSADIRILTHDRADQSPRRVQAALDLGIVAVSVLVTWTAKHLTR